MRVKQVKSVERMKKHGEVLTAPREVNAMLSLVENELKQPESTFLEPACGDGNFLTAILENKLKFLPEKNIKENILLSISSIYGEELLPDNVQTARKRMYEVALGYYTDKVGENVDKDYSDKIKEVLKNNIIQGDFLQNNKYEKMSFDVIIGNPPYQEMDGGGTGDSAKPVYQKFIRKAKQLLPNYIVMIVPSRWMKGGKGLGEFRQEMINDTRIQTIHDYANARTCFPNVHIDGGVCYFLWSKDYDGPVKYHYNDLEGKEYISERFLKTDYTDTVIRDARRIPIIEKALKLNENRFSSIVFSRNPYGLNADLFNSPEKYSDIKIYEEPAKNLYKVYGVKGKKGGSVRVAKYTESSSVTKNESESLKYKLFFSKAYTSTSTVPPEIILGRPEEVCTETFLQIGSFATKEEAENCLKYIKTKFFRALLFFNRHSLNISKESFSLIPLQDFSEEFTDKELYKKYRLEKSDIDYIESVIKPMD